MRGSPNVRMPLDKGGKDHVNTTVQSGTLSAKAWDSKRPDKHLDKERQRMELPILES
jgi:hypothetical protein